MEKKVTWNPEKSQKIREERGFGFEEISEVLDKQGARSDGANPSKNFAHQGMFVVEIEGYPVCVPYVEDDEKIFLKTAFPNRKLKK